MSGLDETMAAAAKEAAAGGGGTPDNQPAKNDGSTEVTEPVEEVTTEDNSSAETRNTDIVVPEGEPEQPGEGTKKVSDSVPYARFKEVNDQHRAEVRRNAELAAKIGVIDQQLKAVLKPQNTGPKLDQNQQQVKEYYLDPVLGPITAQLKSIQDDLTASKESVKLEKELTALSKTYPVINDVPFAREVMENRYLNGGDLEETAQRLQTYFTEREKKLITAYLDGKKKLAVVNKGATPPGSAPAYQPKKLPKSATLDERMAVVEPQIKQAVKNMKE